jgi:hypothetical protein
MAADNEKTISEPMYSPGPIDNVGASPTRKFCVASAKSIWAKAGGSEGAVWTVIPGDFKTNCNEAGVLSQVFSHEFVMAASGRDVCNTPNLV